MTEKTGKKPKSTGTKSKKTKVAKTKKPAGTKSKKARTKGGKKGGSLDSMGIVIVDDDLGFDQDKLNEERRAYLEEARSQEAFD